MQRFGALWVAVFDRMSLVEGEPDTSDLPPLDVPIQAVLGGSSIVIVRELSGTLAGASLGGGGTVWCELTRGAPLGPVFAALLGLIEVSEEHRTDRTPPSRRLSSQGEPSATLIELRTFLEEAPEILAAVVIEEDRPNAPVGVGAFGLDELRELARERMPLLTTPSLGPRGPSSTKSPLEARKVFTAEARGWCFGTCTPDGSRHLWILMDRHAAQGLGWALLTALDRRLPP